MFKDSHGRGRIFIGKKEETGIEAKKWESVHASDFQFSVPVLQMLCEDALGKNCPNKSLFNPPVQKQTLGEASSTHVVRPFKKTIILMVSMGLTPCTLSLARLAEQCKQEYVISEFIILKKWRRRGEMPIPPHLLALVLMFFSCFKLR